MLSSDRVPAQHVNEQLHKAAFVGFADASEHCLASDVLCGVAGGDPSRIGAPEVEHDV